MDGLQSQITRKEALPSATQTPTAKNNFCNWIFENVRPFVNGRVLEVDNSGGYLKAVCIQNSIMIDSMAMDLANILFETNYIELAERFETVFALQIAQQPAHYTQMLDNCTKLLKTGGHLITILPAQTALYNGLSQGYKNWKASNLKFIGKLLDNGYSIIEARLFITGNERSIHQLMGKYNEKVARIISNNESGFIPAGLSLLVIGEKKQPDTTAKIK